ncbi:hypothetical protein KSD_25400 [Ktedonobacter sp. SOSP1-85]|uniref:hypothetical protein n=1 Tax=Ktedonobacter sp. SOSP1-85 TaxID=2778367 RepID=UPI001915C2AE|nr:hypothetical protein [Ktedonobacter sp. SOSP1-85]GHO74769.1 hypothetical protein KSD_25400 [Ktedonobacter sp. SOSP1-85]
MILQKVHYRLGQVRQQMGFVQPLTLDEHREVTRWLPQSALSLFYTMTPADQRHSVRVCQGLQESGCQEEDMLAAALLHDVGKAEGRVPFWTRPVIVLGKLLAPALLSKIAVSPLDAEKSRVTRWRLTLGYAWWHAEVGAELAQAAGLSERAVLYIKTHHQANGPASILHRIDEVS